VIHTQNEKSFAILAPTDVATNATTAATVDTIGFDVATIDIIADSTASTSNKLQTATLTESATSNGTFATWTGSTATTFGNGNTSVPQVSDQFIVDTRARKRFLKVTLQMTAATNKLTVAGKLGRAEISAVAAANDGVGVRNVC